jgi:monoamine oxidase
MSMTRRQLLTGAGRAGGAGATFLLMQALGLLAAPEARAQVPLRLPPGRGRSVTILGAGIAGLVAAYELNKAGYKCVVLEARERPGGRNWTIRRGSKIAFSDGSDQTCTFEEGQHLNAGPARLPSTHATMLGYCRELEVPLEVEVNTTHSALMQSPGLNGGKPVERRQVENDMRGQVAELLTKAIDRGALDRELKAEDKSRLLDFLSVYGDLRGGVFKGTERSGYSVYPGADLKDAVPHAPLPWRALLDPSLWSAILEDQEFGKQATMFQPVGGMDRIPAAFDARLPGIIRYQADVKQIRQSADAVTVSYADRGSGAGETVTADFCICTIPFSVLKRIDADFAPDVKELITTETHDSAYKIAWESRRFWEQDFNIYGGISFVSSAITTIWYPSDRMFSPTGVVVAGFGLEDGEFGRLNLQAKLAASRAAVEKLHPGRSRELRNPVYVNWGRIPFTEGSWSTGYGGLGYARAIEPDRRVSFAGDHTSMLVSWQEGAALSAHRAVSQIGRRMA